MSLATFTESLLAGSRPRVGKAFDSNGATRRPSSEDLDEATLVLVEFESFYRKSLAGTPPRMSTAALQWGLLTAYRVSSCLVYRDASEEQIRDLLLARCPQPASPEVCYSVDLTLRFLPDFVRLAKAASPHDPFVETLKTLARDWPLSSVGIVDLGDCDPSMFISNRSLRMLYVDRIIATKDRSRLNHHLVLDALKAAIGIHSELAPDFVSDVNTLPDSTIAVSTA